MFPFQLSYWLRVELIQFQLHSVWQWGTTRRRSLPDETDTVAVRNYADEPWICLWLQQIHLAHLYFRQWLCTSLLPTERVWTLFSDQNHVSILSNHICPSCVPWCTFISMSSVFCASYSAAASPPPSMTGQPSRPPLLSPFFYTSGGSVGPSLCSAYPGTARLDEQQKTSGQKTSSEATRPSSGSSDERPRRTLPDGQKDGKCGQTGRQRSGSQLINSASVWACCATASGQSGRQEWRLTADFWTPQASELPREALQRLPAASEAAALQIIRVRIRWIACEKYAPVLLEFY